MALDGEFGRWTARPGDDVAVIASDGIDVEGWASVDYTDRLRSLGLNDVRFAEGAVEPVDAGPVVLDPKTLELVRLAALVAVGGAVPSYGAQAEKLPAGKCTIRFDFDFAYDGGGAGKGGTGTLSVNDKQVAEGRIDKTVPVVFSTDDTFDVGADWGTPVSPTYQPPFTFTGVLTKVTVEAK